MKGTLGRLLALPAGIALFALLACSGARPKKAQPKQVEAPQAEFKDPSVVANLGATESQSTELLQESIARVLGFVDIYGKNVNIYQDAYSALYDNLGRQAATGAGTVADPLFYFSPVFIPDTPEIVLLPTGELNINISNLATAKYVRGKIAAKLSETLKAYKINVDKINMLPLASATGQLKAFNREYPATVERDLTRISIVIPKSDIPKPILAMVVAANGAIATSELLKAFSSLPITYRYYVQRYKEQDCHYNIDDTYIRKMFSDSSCAAPTDVKVESDADAAALVTKAAASGSNTVPPGVKQNLGLSDKKSAVTDLVKLAKAPITACMKGEERKKLAQKASVRCTKSSTDVDGKTPKDYDAQMMNFLTKTIEPALATGRLNPDDPAAWDNQAMAAAIRLFGSPDEFRSELNKFNTELQNVVDSAGEANLSTSSKEFADIIEQNGKYTADSKAKSNSSGFNGSLGYGGFGIGGGMSKASSSFNQAIADIVKKSQSTNAKEAARAAQDIFKNYGMDHQVDEVGGKLYFYPKFEVSVRADVDAAKAASTDFATNDLGNIVVEQKEMSVALSRREPLELRLRILCTAPGETEPQEIVAKQVIEQSDWDSDTSANGVVGQLATNVKLKLVTERNCREVRVFAFYVGSGNNKSLVPSSVPFNILGRAAGVPAAAANAATGVPATPAQPSLTSSSSFSLLSTSTVESPATSSKAISVPEGRTFTDIIIGL